MLSGLHACKCASCTACLIALSNVACISVVSSFFKLSWERGVFLEGVGKVAYITFLCIASFAQDLQASQMFNSTSSLLKNDIPAGASSAICICHLSSASSGVGASSVICFICCWSVICHLLHLLLELHVSSVICFICCWSFICYLSITNALCFNVAFKAFTFCVPACEEEFPVGHC